MNPPAALSFFRPRLAGGAAIQRGLADRTDQTDQRGRQTRQIGQTRLTYLLFCGVPLDRSTAEIAQGRMDVAPQRFRVSPTHVQS